MKNDCLVWDDRKFVTTLCVIILTATSLLVITSTVLSLPSGLVHEVHSTEFSNHPSKMIAAWHYVNSMRIPLSCDVESARVYSGDINTISAVFESIFVF